MPTRNRSGTALMTLATSEEPRVSRTTHYLQLCHTTRTLVTLDERRSIIQGLTIGDGWLLARNRETETWVDLAERRGQWNECGAGMRLCLADEQTVVIEQEALTYWFALNGASVTLGSSGTTATRRGWRNLQLRADERTQGAPLDVPYLIPAGFCDEDTDDIVFLGPAYFSEKMRIADLARSVGPAALGRLPLLAGAFAAAAALRASRLSIAASDAAAVSAVVNSLLLLEVYAERFRRKKGRSALIRAEGASSRPA